MTSWYALDRLAAGHRADLAADAAGGVRLKEAQHSDSTGQAPIMARPAIAEEFALERVREAGAIGRLVATVRAIGRT
jgi:hypothetical protein